ncbi:hypothetical protein [Microcoleus sp. CAWBG58]|uniref:hypothetical protein n=1 Tax=Microcoleus sp. CAWBG58 TaxID=2841651 RepID=UPI0025DFD6EB|nr:hypothetical protein [Microcoleus sp. CAWBG58]
MDCHHKQSHCQLSTVNCQLLYHPGFQVLSHSAIIKIGLPFWASFVFELPIREAPNVRKQRSGSYRG